MAELAVFDNAERERLREALKQFKRSHGNLGDFKLYGLMYDILDPQHHVYLSQSTMQRFIRGKGRTTDEAVWAIKTFLGRVLPTGRSDNLAKAFADTMTVPVATIPPVFQKLETYQGRYDLYLQPYTGAFFETEFNAPHPMQFVLFPAADPRYLKVWARHSDTQILSISFQFFLRCGAFQFLLMSTSVGGNTFFTLLSHIEDDPLVLQGTMIDTSTTWPPRNPPYEFRLVRVQSFKLDYKPRPGQYGSQKKK